MLSPCLAFSSWHLISSTTRTLSSPNATHGPKHASLPCWQHHHPISLHLRRLCPHHGVRQLDGHPGGHPEKVPLPSLLHLVLLQPLHLPPLGGHCARLWRHSCVL